MNLSNSTSVLLNQLPTNWSPFDFGLDKDYFEAVTSACSLCQIELASEHRGFYLHGGSYNRSHFSEATVHFELYHQLRLQFDIISNGVSVIPEAPLVHIMHTDQQSVGAKHRPKADIHIFGRQGVHIEIKADFGKKKDGKDSEKLSRNTLKEIEKDIHRLAFNSDSHAFFILAGRADRIKEIENSCQYLPTMENNPKSTKLEQPIIRQFPEEHLSCVLVKLISKHPENEQIGVENKPHKYGHPVLNCYYVVGIIATDENDSDNNCQFSREFNFI
jgi:hypothetical protein